MGLALAFVATLAPAWTASVAGRDWTPQIQATRRAQIYWESLMRGADADVRAAKKGQRQAKRKLQRIERRWTRAAERRGRERDRFEHARRRLSEAREAAARSAALSAAREAAARSAALSAAEAARVLASVALLPGEPVGRDVGLLDVVLSSSTVQAPPLPPGASTPGPSAVGPGPNLRPLEREVRKTKRSLRVAQRKAQRSARNERTLNRRVAALKAAERGAIARRETAEGNLGAWILAMTKYGRIRAAKKSQARPGVRTPFRWPVHGRISQSYHRGHDGLDIVRYSGAPIRAAAFGVVTYVGWNPWDKEGRAFVVVITHATHYETAYGHLLPRRSVRVGEEVRQGEVIGYMGNTGNSTGTHLHFELRRGHTTVNPLGFL
jgi:murein DD-endopeptidase MepM/ murein hydrolase activator NlpD